MMGTNFSRFISIVLHGAAIVAVGLSSLAGSAQPVSAMPGSAPALETFEGIVTADPVPNPTIVAYYDNGLGGSEWALGSTVYVEVDDPVNGTGVDFDGSGVVGQDPTIPGLTWVQFDLDTFQIGAGQEITMWDSPLTTTKTMVVSALSVTSTDLENNVIAGVTHSPDHIYVTANCYGTRAVRLVTPVNGVWSADFSTVGSGPSPEEQVILDLIQGCAGPVEQSDPDGDSTTSQWRAGYPPVLVANLTENMVYSETWPLGSNVTVTIDDASNGPGIDYTDSGTVTPAPWGDPDYTWVEFNVQDFVLEAGDVVTLSGSSFTKELLIEPLEITFVNMVSDTVQGTAVPGATVSVWASNLSGEEAHRVVIADGEGEWIADFSIPGSGVGQTSTFDINAGANIGVDVFDADGDYTEVSETLLNPTIGVTLNMNGLWGDRWTASAPVTLTIDDPSNGVGIDFQQVQTPQPSVGDPNETFVSFDLGLFLLASGDLVKMTNDVFSKSLTVQYVEVTDVNVATDTVSGLADPGVEVFVYLEGPHGFTQRRVVSDAGGTWSVDFSALDPDDSQSIVVDITGGIGGGAARLEADGDLTESVFEIHAPQVSSIDRASPHPTSAANVSFLVTFSEPVTGVDPADFLLMTTGVTGAAITNVSGSGAEYNVTVNTGSGNGEIRLDVMDDNSILDEDSNALGGPNAGDGNFTNGQTYLVRKSATFTDIELSYWAWSFIERLYGAGITGGCNTSPLNYCPEGVVTRAQMAVFLLRGIHSSSYTPPAIGAGSGFGDVPTDYWSAAWIKQLAAEGITTGCGNGNYCPENGVTRAQMAVFLLRSKYGASYTPPAVGAGTGFGDVSSNYWAAAFIKQLVTEGITSGCGNGNYCPEQPVTRAQMAVFLVRTFSLP